MRRIIALTVYLMVIPASVHAQKHSEPLSPLPALSQSQDATNGNESGSGPAWIHLVGGARFKVDEVQETVDGAWYRRGELSVFLERSRIERVERLAPTPARTPKIEIQNFAAGYLGDNSSAVYSALNRHQSALVKSQFETTSNYQSRLTTLLSRIALTARAKASESLTFVLESHPDEYDADGARYLVKPEVNPSGIGESSTTLKSSSRVIGSAVGRNAFGVKIPFKILRYVNLSLELPRERAASWQSGLVIPEVSPERARKLMGRVRVALIGKVAPPFVSYNSESDSATLTQPQESHFHNLSLFFEPDSLVVYYLPTGEILGSVNLRALRTEQYVSNPPLVLDVQKPISVRSRKP